MASNLKSFFIRKWVVLSLLLVVVLVASEGWSRLNINNSIYGIFPDNKDYTQLINSVEDNKLFNKIVFSIEYEEVTDSLFNSLVNQIYELSDGQITDLRYHSVSNEEKLLSHFYDVPYYFLEESDYARLSGLLKEDSIAHRLQATLNSLSSFNTSFYSTTLPKDPLGITTQKLQSFLQYEDQSALKNADEYLYNESFSAYMLLGSLENSLNSEKDNEELEHRLNKLREEIKENGVEMNFFAPFVISNSNAFQAKKDTILTVSITLILLLIILLFFYKSLLVSTLFIIPLVGASFLGVGLAAYIQPDISAISIASSAILLGIVLDYAFHFITHFFQTSSVQATIKQVSKPMLLGSFTTIGAFGALIFTESKVLNDFGLMALLILASAVFSTLVILPIVIEGLHFKPNKKARLFKWKTPKFVAKASLLITLGLVIFYLFNPPSINFNSDLNSLSFQDDEIKQLEEKYTGVNPDLHKTVTISVSAPELEEAIIASQILHEQISRSEKLELRQIISVAPFIYSRIKAQEQQKNWLNFWAPRREEFKEQFNFIADSLGFNTNSFEQFYNLISDTTKIDTDLTLLKDLGLEDLLNITNEEVKISSSVIIAKEDVAELKKLVSQIKNVVVFETSFIAQTLLESISADFQFLLIISSCIVFISLLLVYGRIELAVFSFFPMAVSWVLILYLASVFDLHFNFVNILLVTIIFGLGDDFSIFMTDGLLKKYIYKSDVINSYKSAIILSALTTVISTGSLYFAKHPAINSIALLSVTGIAVIVFVNLVMQPAIFDFFVLNRTYKKQNPISIKSLFTSIYIYSVFLIGCLLLNIVLPFLILTPISRQKKRSILNYLIHYCCRGIIFASFPLKITFKQKEILKFNKPSILVSNHNSLIDIVVLLALSPKLILIVKEWVYQSPIFGLFIRYSGYVCVKSGIDSNQTEIQKRIEEGYTIGIFPEGTRSNSSNMNRFHKGAFHIANELKLAIQPVAISGLEKINNKDGLMISPGEATLTVIPLVDYNKARGEEKLGFLARRFKAIIQTKIDEEKKTRYNIHTLKERVLTNYLYKGPITEWYTRIKWRLEKHNFEYYKDLTKSKKIIYDLGCGFGYLSFFLHYCHSEAEIIGVDYDESKVLLAANCHDKKERLNFISTKIQDLDFKKFDVAFFNDVLHYLPSHDRMKVLKNALNQLNDDGLILIRDGFKNIKKHHKVTAFTEWLSTKVLLFNKVDTKLDFFTEEEVRDFAKTHKLSCQRIQQGKITSNNLLILRKENDGKI